MCGIFAVYAPRHDALNLERCRRARSSIRHRGPDDAGEFMRPGIYMGFQRLSILDLSPAGHQPMIGADGKVALTFNGQIYNYRELRAELTAKGYKFRSSGDTEVLLNMYLEYGLRCFERLRGMWGIVIWDERSRQLILSRDRIGLKPLYVHCRDGRWTIASEMRAILSYVPDAAELDDLAAYRFIARGSQDFSDRTFFKDIKSLPPATVRVFCDGEMQDHTFWRLAVRPDRSIAPAQIGETFVDTIARHMQSDVPVGLALSGGVDSGAIACAVARKLGRGSELHGFSVCPPGTPDESELIDATVAYTGIRHTYVELSALDYPALIQQTVIAHESPPPKVSHLYQFLLRRWVGEHGYKVMLVGEGADEIFGGYAAYTPMYLAALEAAGLNEEIDSFLAGAEPLTGVSRGEMITAKNAFLSTGTGSRLVQREHFGREILADRFNYEDNRAFPRFRWEELASQPGPAYLYREMLDRFRIDMPMILRIEDRSGMDQSLEIRAPFLDHVMVEIGFSIPEERYMQGGINKRPFREAVSEFLTPAVQSMQKKLRRPGNDALVVYNYLADDLRDLLGSRSLREAGIFRPDIIELFNRDAESGHFHHAFVWFRCYVFACWWSIFIDRARTLSSDANYRTA